MKETSLKCEHNFVHQETIKYTEDGEYSTHYVRVDRYYCQRCLKTEELRNSGYARKTPEWYR